MFQDREFFFDAALWVRVAARVLCTTVWVLSPLGRIQLDHVGTSINNLVSLFSTLKCDSAGCCVRDQAGFCVPGARR